MGNLEYLKMLLNFPRYYKGGKDIVLAKKLEEMYKAKKVYLFSNARTAEYVFLKSLGLPLDSEVLLQAFTCNAVVNPILWLKHKPVYVDINPQRYTIDIESLKQRYTDNSEVLIVQHTFGINGLTDSINKYAKEKGLYILEDCAHALGNTDLGTKGDAAIVSFGIEKILSTRVGGALIVNNVELINRIDQEYINISKMSFLDTFLWMLNPIIWRGVRKLGVFQKVVSLLLNRLGIVNMGFYAPENRGMRPGKYPRKLPSVLSAVVLDQLQGIDKNLSHREYINDLYASALDVPHLRGVSSVRFPLVVKDVQVLNMVKKVLDSRSVYYGDWYNPLIYPASTHIESMGYRWSDCPVAEEISRHILNLPTGASVSKAHALEISRLVRDVLKQA